MFIPREALVFALTSFATRPQARETVWPVVVGASLGFLGSTIGSVIVSRAESRRNTRIEVHQGLIPNLKSAAIAASSPSHQRRGNYLFQLGAAIDDLRRRTVLLARSERKSADSLLRLFEERLRVWHSDGRNEYGMETFSEMVVTNDERLAEEMDATISRLDELLRKKLKRFH